MDEDISIIDTKTRNEKIKSFLIKNKKKLIFLFIIVIIFILSFYSYQMYQNKQNSTLSDKYNIASIEYEKGNEQKTISIMKEVIEKKNSTYSPLGLYFLIDNNLIKNKEEVNNLFDILIDETNLDYEIKNLIIYKKGLYNADTIDENGLLNILSPLINSKSIWKSHALYLAAEFFYFKNEKQKAKEFFTQIIQTNNVNQEILKEAQKRLNRDLSE